MKTLPYIGMHQLLLSFLNCHFNIFIYGTQRYSGQSLISGKLLANKVDTLEPLIRLFIDHSNQRSTFMGYIACTSHDYM